MPVPAPEAQQLLEPDPATQRLRNAIAATLLWHPAVPDTMAATGLRELCEALVAAAAEATREWLVVGHTSGPAPDLALHVAHLEHLLAEVANNRARTWPEHQQQQLADVGDVVEQLRGHLTDPAAGTMPAEHVGHALQPVLHQLRALEANWPDRGLAHAQLQQALAAVEQLHDQAWAAHRAAARR